MTISVSLTEQDLIMCRLIGNMRSLVARNNSVGDKKMGSQSGSQIDEDGVIGEFAFCKHFNIFFDMGLSPRSGSYDCLLRGKRVDVKTTRYKSGRLLATTKINYDVDIYVLAILEDNTVTFVGWTEREILTSAENLKDLGRGEGYSLDQSALKSFSKQA
jgi:hypothetical protein